MNAWQQSAQDLAAWAMARLVNRTDRCGGYFVDAAGETKTCTRPGKGPERGFLDDQRLRAHFRGCHVNDVLGVHALSRQSAGRWVGWDIDAHEGSDADPVVNERYTFHLYHSLVTLGFQPLLYSSNGKGGYHLWALLAESVAGEVLFRFGRWLVRDHAVYGFSKPPEVFPKQPRLTETTLYGNWLRVPGRHPKRDHWPSVWTGERWVEGDAAVQTVLALAGDKLSLIPGEAKTFEAHPGAAALPGRPNRVGDVFAEFNRSQTLHSMAALLRRHGWKTAAERDDRWDVIRPGKDSGQGGNLKLVDGVPILYLFTTGTDLPACQGRNPSQVRSDLEFQGDYAALARALQQEGYGPATRVRSLPSDPTSGSEPLGTGDSSRFPPKVHGGPTSERTKPTIVVGPDEHRVNDEAVAALEHDPDLYTHAGRLARVIVQDEEDARKVKYPRSAKVSHLTAWTLRERLTLDARWVRAKQKDGETQLEPTAPAMPNIFAILDRESWPGIREITAVVDFPIMLPEGEILTKPGFHHESGIFYAPIHDVSLAIPEHPNRDDAIRAANVLIDLVGDFPFADDHHRAAWLAALLTPLARYSIQDCVPFFLFEANAPGTGKTLLVDITSHIIRGGRFAVASMPESNDEMKKTLTSIMIRGSSMALFDNIEHRLGCAALNVFLTGHVWEDRVLGVNRMVGIPSIYTTLYGTGNNISVIGDFLRRACSIRLVTRRERPEERTDIRIKDLRAHVEAHRSQYLSAALTLLQAYHHAGRPDQHLPAWGSFEAWSDLVRGAIVWAGLPDPFETRKAMREERGDDRIAAFVALLENWTMIDPDGVGLTAASIVKRIDELPNGDLHETLTALVGPKESTKGDRRGSKLGYVFREFDSRVFGEQMIRKGGTHAGVKRWRVVSVGGEGGDANRSKRGGDGGDGGDGPSPSLERFSQHADFLGGDGGDTSTSCATRTREHAHDIRLEVSPPSPPSPPDSNEEAEWLFEAEERCAIAQFGGG